MSQSSENEALTPQELREALLSEIEVSQQAISELNDEQLEEIVGGINGATRANVRYLYKQTLAGNMNHVSSLRDMIQISRQAFQAGKAGDKIQ
jgi:hypothetical protein